MCHCSPILAIRPSTRGLNNLQKRWFELSQTDIQTSGHLDSMTESAQWAISVKINVSEPDLHFNINLYGQYQHKVTLY